MKHLLAYLAAIFIVGCSSPNKAKPLIKEYLMETISNPDTYKAGKTEVVAKGTINVRNVVDWKHIPTSGDIKVVVLRHEFTHDNRSNNVIDNAYYFYVSPSYDVLYYAHKDTDSGPRFKLQ